jgi:hypothetical protein
MTRVFDIEIDEGVTLKLGYNHGQNPYAVAQDFIWANDLPQEHLDQIANFIDKNAGAVTLGMDAPMTRGVDPFTGGSNAMYEAPRAAPGGGAAAGQLHCHVRFLITHSQEVDDFLRHSRQARCGREEGDGIQ